MRQRDAEAGYGEYTALSDIVVLVVGTLTVSRLVDPSFCQWLNVSEPYEAASTWYVCPSLTVNEQGEKQLCKIVPPCFRVT